MITNMLCITFISGEFSDKHIKRALEPFQIKWLEISDFKTHTQSRHTTIISDTRWLSKVDTIYALKYNYQDVNKALMQISTNQSVNWRRRN